VEEDTIEVPSESGDVSEDDAEDAVESLDTEAVADRVTEAANRLRADASGYNPELERTHSMDKAASEHAETMENNINEDEELDSIRSGDVPAQTSERNRKQRYIRNAATACHTGGGSNSLYTQGSYVTLTDDVEGTIDRTGTSTTTVNAEGMAPVTVPNYALPLSEAYIYDSWKAGGEINAAYAYDDLVNGTASSSEVADDVVDRMTENDSFVDTMTESSYEHQGVGVAVDEDAGVVYVTQSFC
ncbi:MAG: hypothetical protein ACLFSW_04640, partial [Halobacteriales archaeon]